MLSNNNMKREIILARRGQKNVDFIFIKSDFSLKFPSKPARVDRNFHIKSRRFRFPLRQRRFYGKKNAEEKTNRQHFGRSVSNVRFYGGEKACLSIRFKIESEPQRLCPSATERHTRKPVCLAATSLVKQSTLVRYGDSKLTIVYSH